MAMIRVKLKRTIYTEYEPKLKRGGIKSERSANKRVVHFSSVVPVKSFSEESASEGIVKSEIPTQLLNGNNADWNIADSKIGMFFVFVSSYKILFVLFILFEIIFF